MSGAASPALASAASALSTVVTLASSPAKVISSTRRIVALSSATKILVGTRSPPFRFVVTGARSPGGHGTVRGDGTAGLRGCASFRGLSRHPALHPCALHTSPLALA